MDFLSDPMSWFDSSSARVRFFLQANLGKVPPTHFLVTQRNIHMCLWSHEAHELFNSHVTYLNELLYYVI